MKIALFILASLVLFGISILLFGPGRLFLMSLLGDVTKQTREEGRLIRVLALILFTLALNSSIYIGWAQLCAAIFHSDSLLVMGWGWVIATSPHSGPPWNSDTIPLKLAGNLAYLGFWLGPVFGVSPCLIWAATLAFATLPCFMSMVGGELRRSGKGVSEAFRILAEARSKFDPGSFDLVSETAKKQILANHDQFVDVKSVRKHVYFLIANISGAMAESGHYHICRGILTPIGPGKDLLKTYDSAMDELVHLGVTSPEEAAERKKSIRKNIQSMG